MTKHFHVVLWLPLLYCALFLIFWIRIYLAEGISFEDFILEKQANYAADSAIEEILMSSDLSTDYADGDFVTLEPQLAVRDFAITLCYDFGYVPTEDNIELVKNNHIRMLTICTYDGMYANYLMRTSSTETELKQTPKIPYFYTAEDGTQYCLTLNPQKGYWDYGSTSSTYGLHKYDNYQSAPSADIQRTYINNQVADVCNWALYETMARYEDSNLSVTLPAIADRVKGEQPVASPTVIGVVQGKYTAYFTKRIAECIGGAQLEETDQIVGFELRDCPIYVVRDTSGTYTNGDIIATGDEAMSNPNRVLETTLSGKFYARSSWWKKHSYIKKGNYIVGNNSRYFDDEFEAAKLGYNDLNLVE